MLVKISPSCTLMQFHLIIKRIGKGPYNLLKVDYNQLFDMPDNITISRDIAKISSLDGQRNAVVWLNQLVSAETGNPIGIPRKDFTYNWKEEGF